MDKRPKRPPAQMRAKAVTRKSKPKARTTPKPSRAKSSREKVRSHRKRMRAKGYRLLQMWVPDTRSPEFARQAHLQSLRASNSPTAELDQSYLDSISWWNSEEAAALSKSEPPLWWRKPE